MLVCPTSEVPICPSGRPTYSPEACSWLVWNFSIRPSSTGVLAICTALFLSVLSPRPQPSMMMSATGAFLSFAIIAYYSFNRTGLVVNDLAEVFCLQGSAANECTVDIRLLHEVSNRSRFYAAAVLDTDCISARLAKYLSNSLADMSADFLSLLERSRLARADSP